MSLLFLAILILLGVLLQYLSRRRGLEGIQYSFRTDRQLVEPDEVFSIETTVTNSSKIPVLYLKISEELPDAIQVNLPGEDIRYFRHEGYGFRVNAGIEQTVWLMPHQRIIRTLDVSLPCRGRYVFQSVTLSTGDFLGLEEHTESIPRLHEIVVIPSRADIAPFESAFSNYLGELSVRRYILPDPILTVGFREYTGREPMRDISWPRTLRDGHLMVKQYDYTAEPSASVLLNIDGADNETREQCFRAARTVCEILEHRRIPFSFRTNACTYGRLGRWSSIPEGLGEHHLLSILDGLGRAGTELSGTFPALLKPVRNCGTQGCILITPPLSAESEALVRRFEQHLAGSVFLLRITTAEEEAAG